MKIRGSNLQSISCMSVAIVSILSTLLYLILTTSIQGTYFLPHLTGNKDDCERLSNLSKVKQFTSARPGTYSQVQTRTNCKLIRLLLDTYPIYIMLSATLIHLYTIEKFLSPPNQPYQRHLCSQ